MPSALISALAALLLLVSGSTAQAGECGHPVSAGPAPRAVDALHILHASIGARECTLGTCDVNGDCEVTVVDALGTLVASVGGSADMHCDGGCPTEIPCEYADAPMCNGICPMGYVCTVDDSGEVDPDKRATVCHVPPGNPSNAHTITVGVAAVNAHLAHGDYLGPCEDGDAEPLPADRLASKKWGDGDSDSDSDSDRGRRAECLCVPQMISTTTTMVEPTTTTTVAEPTTTTTVTEPTTTTTVAEPTTTTTVTEPTTTTTVAEPTTTTTVTEPTTTTV